MLTIIIINHPITQNKMTAGLTRDVMMRMMMMRMMTCVCHLDIICLQNTSLAININCNRRKSVCLCVCVQDWNLILLMSLEKAEIKKRQTVLDILMPIGLGAQEADDGGVSVHSNVNEAPNGSCRGEFDAVKYAGSQCAMKNPLDKAAGRNKHLMDHFSVF